MFCKQTSVAEKPSGRDLREAHYEKSLLLHNPSQAWHRHQSQEEEVGGEATVSGQGAWGAGSSFRPSLTGFFLSWLFPFYSDFPHLCVLLSLGPLTDNIMLMCVCVYVCTHMYVFNSFSASHAFIQLSPLFTQQIFIDIILCACHGSRCQS